MHLLSIADLSKESLEQLIKDSIRIKKNPEKYKGKLSEKSIVLLFEKPSTRTRVSFEIAMNQFGGNVIYIDSRSTHLSRGESIADTGKIFSRYADAILARVYKHSTLEELAGNSEIPVINALSDLEHPCQVISDLFTIYEIMGTFKGIEMAYIGDGNNVCNSLILGCSILGINLRVSCPVGYEPDKGIINGGKVEVLHDPLNAATGADFLYTDTWVSMGNEDEAGGRKKAFQGYQINSKILEVAKDNCRVMHCLPAHRGEEITSEVMDGPNSIIWQQAENRVYANKAILLKLLK